MTPGARLLDFGCGAGEFVQLACRRGLDAYGCDIDFSAEYFNQQALSEMRREDRVREIETPYRVPFGDASFDFVVSDQVFEHVRNYEQAVSELRRVMKPGAVCLHIFPSRYILIEPHLFVPFASCFHPRWWLTLWAALGVRNQFQQGLSVAETVERNAKFLSTGVNYLPPSELARQFSRGFRTRDVERQLMNRSRRAKMFLLPVLYRTFWQRCLLGIKV